MTPPSVPNHAHPYRTKGTGPDSDGDGLSDDFEKNVFHSNPNQRDEDADGLSDWAEYWVDTNPTKRDTDGDGWEDGEDLAFGDPLRWNDGGEGRAKLVAQARQQFELEGSDRDHDLVRDHLEGEKGTKVDDADSDNDGLGDMVELQLGTDPNGTPNGTADLDRAIDRLGEQRWETDHLSSVAGDYDDTAESESLDVAPVDDGSMDF